MAKLSDNCDSDCANCKDEDICTDIYEDIAFDDYDYFDEYYDYYEEDFEDDHTDWRYDV